MLLAASPSRCRPESPSLATLKSPGTARNASKDCVSLPHTAWGSALACRPAARTQPPPQVLGIRTALVHLGAAVVGITRNHWLPSNAVSKLWQSVELQPWTQKKGCSALLPGLFPGPSPRPVPNGSSLHSGSQTHMWVPKVANIPALYETPRPTSLLTRPLPSPSRYHCPLPVF